MLRGGCAIRPAERLDEVRDGVDVLPVGEADQLDARRVVPGAGFAGVEGFVDVAGDGGGLHGIALVRFVLRHVLINVTRQFFDRPIAVQRVVIFAFHTLAVLAVAANAMLAIDVATGGVQRGGFE